MAALKNSSRLKGYVLLESMIAMIVVMLCFGMATLIYNNVVSGAREKLKVLARIRLENEALRTKTEKRFLDETFEYDEFRIQQQVSPHPGTEAVYELQLSAVTPDGKKLAEYHELFRQP